MYNPVATIRIQFNKEFTFRRFRELIPFFKKLGTRTIYASPIFKAVEGSMHGYDVVSPLEINPEIGTLSELQEISQELKQHGIGWIQDIVPNHMAFNPATGWLADVLEKGAASRFKDFFDTPFHGDFYHGELMAPKDASTPINYRRFFTISELICLNMEEPHVFTTYHELIEKLSSSGIISGVRVDHIDGLYDPRKYLRELRALLGASSYIIIEKILEPDEPLEENLPIQGTTGYEFLAAVNNLFTWQPAEEIFGPFYESLLKRHLSTQERIHEKKRLILTTSFAGELRNLTTYFIDLKLPTRPVVFDELKEAIAAMMIYCPWYRFYGNTFPLRDVEKEQIDTLLSDCEQHYPALKNTFDILREVLLGDNNDALKFYQRLMQFTGPLMAKGVEDTLMYTYNRFIGHNEVGDSPEEFGMSISEFHRSMQKRSKRWNYALNATATHDTKRGEDARMRLAVLTDVAEEWTGLVARWLQKNGSAGIDQNDQYFIYQTLVATYPNNTEDDYITRLDEYLTKAFREAKRHTNWEQPNEDFENNVKEFVRRLLADGRDSMSGFMSDFLPFLQKVADYGFVKSVSQLVLKMTCPGIPDTYQGSLSWDYSFVDPDNRRPVSYEKYMKVLNDADDLVKLWATRQDGRIKVRLTQHLLGIRSEYAPVFTTGSYIPLRTSGQWKDHLLAFARVYQGQWIITAVVLHPAQVGNDWKDTKIILPPEAPASFSELLTGDKKEFHDVIEVNKLFAALPVTVLASRPSSPSRKAGVLMSITSLPSDGPIGDLGPAARQFADFLFESRQRIWQMLPVTITDKTVGFSPYSSYSSIAGNPLLISIEDLANDDVTKKTKTKTKTSAKVDYEAATRSKLPLLKKAWKDFKRTREFEEFLQTEKDWLDNFALFEYLYRANKNQPWNKWPAKYATRDERALEELSVSHKDDLDFIKWQQFVFSVQMRSLRAYCNARDIELIGDVPFYVSFNSVDVWTNPELFAIDNEMSIEAMAGVPPDYFNDEGQLWGMPVYRWEKHAEQNFSWWVQRIRGTLKFFDRVRLDHFRAFDEYWSVPNGVSAKNGSWMEGPGSKIFDIFRRELGRLPFIAEDLGDVDERVFELRDKVGLPGMKVVQFAFGDDFPTSPHLPHYFSRNFFAYTGTHDNNTTKGWFHGDALPRHRANVARYLDNPRLSSIAEDFTRMVYASVADACVIPVQDIIGIGLKGRMNKPSTTTGNWTWRLKKIPAPELSKWLRQLVATFDR